ncbi:MAG: hypothetical protein AB8B50_08220 [Pirellulaceae bacterium]
MRRVVKVGGSLLNLADLPQRLRKWSELQKPGVNLFVVGGGGIVEAMRELDAIHEFEPAQVHWWCVQLLSTSAVLLSSLVPEWQLLQTDLEVTSALGEHFDKNANRNTSFILDTGRLFGVEEDRRKVEAHCSQGVQEGTVQLPEDWSTTTDSIAAWLCCRFAADELVLLKSIDVMGCDWDSHAQSGFVDRAFPKIAAQVTRIRVVNLRSVQWSPVSGTSTGQR